MNNSAMAARMARIKSYKQAMILWVGLFSLFSLAIWSSIAAIAGEKFSSVSDMRFKLEQDLLHSQDKIDNLQQNLQLLKQDQKTLTQELIEAAQKEREISKALADKEKQLAPLLAKKNQLDKDWASSYKEFIEIIIALQRIESLPFSSFLMAPRHSLVMMRAALLLGTSAQSLKERLVFLNDLRRKQADITLLWQQKLEEFRHNLENYYATRQKVMLLLAQKAKSQQLSQQELAAQEKRRKELLKRAKSLADILKLLTQESEQRKLEIIEKLQNAPAFATLQGQLSRPLLGRVVTLSSSENSAFSQGELLETSPHAIVRSPSDAIILYADSFRSYGKIVILALRDGYYLLLAGLAEIKVIAGQFIAIDEPIGVIGTALGSLLTDKNRALLYLELRKNGKAIALSPWWKKDNN